MLSIRAKSYRTRFAALALVGLIAQPLRAGVIPGRWEKVSHLEAGASLTVKIKNGDRVKGHFLGLSKSKLELLIHPSRAAIPRDGIQRITHQPRDTVGDGVGKGAAVGAGVGAAFGALLVGSIDGGSAEGMMAGAGYGAGFGVLFGVGLGLLSDAVVKTPSVVVYEAPRNSR